MLGPSWGRERAGLCVLARFGPFSGVWGASRGAVDGLFGASGVCDAQIDPWCGPPAGGGPVSPQNGDLVVVGKAACREKYVILAVLVRHRILRGRGKGVW